MNWINLPGKWLIFLLIGLLSLVLISCWGDKIVAPEGVTEGGNTEIIAMRGKVVDVQGNVISNTLVTLRSSGHFGLTQPNSNDNNKKKEGIVHADRITDINGEFSIDSVRKGHYVVAGFTSDATLSGLQIANVELPGKDFSLNNIVLQPSGTISGKVNIESKGHPYYVSVLGLENRSVVDPLTGQFEISGLPAGTLDLMFYTDETVKRQEQIEVFPGQSAAIENIEFQCPEIQFNWRRVDTISINTTEFGANISENISQFPILINLNNENYNFDGLDLFGHKIRFTDLDGCVLPHHVEEWFTTFAAVWVKVNHIRGNHINRIIMYSGVDKGRLDSISRFSLFQQKDGFKSVFHLSDSGPTPRKNFTDGASTLTIHNQQMVGAGQGYIIGGEMFDGKSTLEVSGHTYESFSFSAWVKLDSQSNSLSKSIILNQDGALTLSVNQSNILQLETFINKREYQVKSKWPNSTLFDWHYVSATFDGGALRIYIDGAMVGAEKVSGFLPASGHSTYFGGLDSNNPQFYGHMDEIRLSIVARSGLWFKYCFENQKKDQRMILIKGGNS